MILHSSPLVNICFGDSRDSIDPQEYNSKSSYKWINAFSGAKKFLKFDDIVVLKQVHSDNGQLVTQDNLTDLKLMQNEGDYIVTNLKNIGLAVLTADCLPIVFYDSYSNAIGICHAGWRGSFQEIAKATVIRMQEEFGTQLDRLSIFFGPSAKICCYKVDNKFKDNLKKFDYYKNTIIENNGNIFFNLPLFNQLQLQDMGIKKEAFHCKYSLCTICNGSFCSYRRDKEKSKRQVTIVALK